MIRRVVKRGFSSSVYSWGRNYVNLGYPSQALADKAAREARRLKAARQEAMRQVAMQQEAMRMEEHERALREQRERERRRLKEREAEVKKDGLPDEYSWLGVDLRDTTESQNEKLNQSIAEQPESKVNEQVNKVQPVNMEPEELEEQQEKLEFMPNLPRKLKFKLNGNVKKIISGLSEAVILTDQGEVQMCGGQFVWADVRPEFSPIALPLDSATQAKLVDLDIDRTHLIALTSEGEVYETKNGNAFTKVALPHPARMVAAGDSVSFAVLRDEQGHDKLYGWGCPASHGSAIFCLEYNLEREPSELVPVNSLIGQTHSAIKKLRVVGYSAMVLLDNGQLVSWGDNSTGNLAVPRSELALEEDYVYQPSLPLQLCKISERVVDFEMSDNLLCILTETGAAYYSGMNGVLSLKKVDFFPDMQIAKVGCAHDKFFLVTANGRIFSNQPFDDEPNIKYFGELELYELDRKYFESSQAESLSGKYHNTLALFK